MADTALDVISRWRMMSVSSSVGGGAGGCSGAEDVRQLSRQIEVVHLRGETPGGKPFPVADDGGLPPVAAETVAKSSLRTTNTQADITGNMEPCGYNQHRARMSIGELRAYICSTRLRRERSSRSCLALRLSPEVSAVLKASSASARRASRRATSGSVVPLSSSA
jgi:hypothetical protein